MIHARFRLAAMAAALVAFAGGASAQGSFGFELTWSEALRAGPVEGRAFVVLSRDPPATDLLRVSYGAGTHPLFGVDVRGIRPGEPVRIGAAAPGYPVPTLGDLPAGTYYAQGLLVPYETFERADGHVVQFPLDRGEGQRWKIQPGTLHSEVVRVQVGPRSGEVVRLPLTRREPELEPIRDSPWVRHVRLRSEALSTFWGRDMDVGAYVLLPKGFHENPEARYPVVYFITNFHRDFDNYVGFRDSPPPSTARGWERVFGEEAHEFHQQWTTGVIPPLLLVAIQNSTPFYRGSFGVNSRNAGPYEDALLRELLPYLEREFRAIGEGWSRTLYGTGTGAWHALAWQVRHPEMFNGVWSFGPDPVDFRAFNLVNIYSDANAFHADHPYRSEPVRPYERAESGETLRTVKQQSQLELVFGTRGRNAEDLNASAAAFGPVAPDGYPSPLWDPLTGVIDRAVAEQWREFDLRHVLERDWAIRGHALAGKIHILVRDPDPYFRDVSVRMLEEFLESTTAPHYGGSIRYRRRDGEGEIPERLGRLRAARTALPEMIDRVRSTAPRPLALPGWEGAGAAVQTRNEP